MAVSLVETAIAEPSRFHYHAGCDSPLASHPWRTEGFPMPFWDQFIRRVYASLSTGYPPGLWSVSEVLEEAHTRGLWDVDGGTCCRLSPNCVA